MRQADIRCNPEYPGGKFSSNFTSMLRIRLSGFGRRRAQCPPLNIRFLYDHYTINRWIQGERRMSFSAQIFNPEDKKPSEAPGCLHSGSEFAMIFIYGEHLD